MNVEDTKGTEKINRGVLISQMQEKLPAIMAKLDLTDEKLADMSGIAKERIRAAKRGKSGSLKWSEYLSLLFIFWKNDVSRGLIEDAGLFPKELKDVMLTNRLAHSPSDVL